MLEYIAPASSFVALLIMHLDSMTSGPAVGTHLRRVGAVLFGSHRRTVLAYALPLAGITVYPVWLALPYFMVEPIVPVFYTVLAAFVVGLSTQAARDREARMARIARAESLRQNEGGA